MEILPSSRLVAANTLRSLLAFAQTRENRLVSSEQPLATPMVHSTELYFEFPLANGLQSHVPMNLANDRALAPSTHEYVVVIYIPILSLPIWFK